MQIGFTLNRNLKSIQFSGLKKIGYDVGNTENKYCFLSSKLFYLEKFSCIAILKFDRSIHENWLYT